ncbi:MAG: RnfABCDGE type electron transport complex subunit G [bacterium]|nr:RnfABCDGE type electron transport complex subunit G [bacterium]MCX7917360.1 RnfABCDGE type electron transport complex subunit G [bacterium]MDW8164768.1 RnfABCDGE type electron transport complex subunit G [Candidatus Omnitrophota bacterium]
MSKKDIIKGILVITIVCSLSGYLLAQVYKTTKPKIEEIKKQEEEKLNKEIFPEGVKFEEKEINGIKYFSVLNESGEEIGKIFEVKTMGYGGYITLKVGLDKENKIKKIKVKEHNETPGLGSKITQESFLNQFIGKTKNEIYLKKDKTDGKIDSITGATISSKAVVDGVRKLLDKIIGEQK